VRAVCAWAWGSPDLQSRTMAVVGLGSVGGHLARQLSAAGVELVVSDIDLGKRALAEELGARWASPSETLAAHVDVLVPAALGGTLTSEIVPSLRCAAIVGPANNQLAGPSVAGLLHQRGIIWVPDYVASAGGVIYALAVELHKQASAEALARVRAIADTVALILQAAERSGTSPAQAAQELADNRLSIPPYQPSDPPREPCC